MWFRQKEIDKIVGHVLEVEKRMRERDVNDRNELYHASQRRLIRSLDRAKQHRVKTWGRRVRA